MNQEMDTTRGKQMKTMTPIDETQISRDRDTEKRIRKDAEHRLSDAAELLARIASGELSQKEAIIEATAWLKDNDPFRVPRQYRLVTTVDQNGENDDGDN